MKWMINFQYYVGQETDSDGYRETMHENMYTNLPMSDIYKLLEVVTENYNVVAIIIRQVK